jgi:methionine synthase II (cobalamin-independent)
VNTLLPTTLVGSYPQPEWLIDRQRLATSMPPRVRVESLWRVPAELLDFYASEGEMAFDYADAVNAEIKDLFARRWSTGRGSYGWS